MVQCFSERNPCSSSSALSSWTSAFLIKNTCPVLNQNQFCVLMVTLNKKSKHWTSKLCNFHKNPGPIKLNLYWQELLSLKKTLQTNLNKQNAISNWARIGSKWLIIIRYCKLWLNNSPISVKNEAGMVDEVCYTSDFIWQNSTLM